MPSTVIAPGLSYMVIPGRIPPGYPYIKEYEKAFAFWKAFWTREFDRISPDHRLNPDDFFRQDRIGVLFQNSEVVGVHAYSLYDLRTPVTWEHSYFQKYYPEEFLQELKRRGIRSVMTMEFFAVGSRWRSNASTKLPFAALLAGLGFRMSQHLGVDGTITVARIDVGAAKMSHNYGGVSLISGVSFYNCACDLVLFRTEELRPYPWDQVNALLEKCWRERNDTVEDVPEAPVRRAA